MDDGPLTTPQKRITPAFLDVIEFLAQHRDSVHGYAILDGIGRPRQSSAYAVLHRLVDFGWAEVSWDHDTTPARRMYALTDDGRTAVKELLAERRPPPALAAG